VTNAAEVACFVEATEATLGPIDAFANNAGVEGVIAPIYDYPEAQLDFPQFLSCAGLCGGPEDVLGGDELEGAIDR